MAQYKVPQNVEAEDKILGPFSFRQFVYLLIAGGLIALAIVFFKLFPLLAIIPIPFILLFLVLALPLKKDQPMETYLIAIVSYYLKPHNRLWTAGQRESTIKITAPKVVEESRTRDITGEEATHRLSFLADIVDTGGYAIKSGNTGLMREDLVAEANAAEDMFENYRFNNLNDTIQKDEEERHREVVREMQQAIDESEKIAVSGARVQKRFNKPEPRVESKKNFEPEIKAEPKTEEIVFNSSAPALESAAVVKPIIGDMKKTVENSVRAGDVLQKNNSTISAKPSIIELANNNDYSVQTIAKEANRINRKEDGEVFISLH